MANLTCCCHTSTDLLPFLRRYPNVTSASSIFIFVTWAQCKETSEHWLYMIPVQINNGLFQPDTVAEKRGSWGPFGDQMLRSLSAPSLWFKTFYGQTVRSCVNQYVSGTTAVYKNTCPYVMMSVSVFMVRNNCCFSVRTLTLRQQILHYNMSVCSFVVFTAKWKLIVPNYKWLHSNDYFICMQPLFWSLWNE